MPGDQAALDAYFAAKGWGKPHELVSYEHVPGFYRADFSDGGVYVLIQGGKVVTAKGLPAVEAYAHASKLVSHKPSADDVVRLLTVLEALPPSKVPAPDQYYDLAEHAELKPRLDDSGKLTLNYLMPRAGGAVANPSVVRVTQWTLPLGGKLAWKSEERQFDLSK